jgi:predicted DNA-binding transcriptional regulator AlpA
MLHRELQVWRNLGDLRYTVDMNAETHRTPVGPVVGLEAIGRLFGRSRQTISRWIKDENFPAAYLPDGTWVTSHSLIDDWLFARVEYQRED